MKIKLYTLSTCPWCAKAKKFFKNKKIKFEFVDYDLVDEDKKRDILAEIRKHSFKTTFPIAVIDTEVVVGYDPEKYEEILAKCRKKEKKN